MTDQENARIYGRTETPHGEVEVTVKGGPDEDAEDIADTFDARLEELADAQDALVDEDDDKYGVE